MLGVLNATEWKPPCPQTSPPWNIEVSEDCLYLNIWTPPNASMSSEKFAVMVWIYGGMEYIILTQLECWSYNRFSRRPKSFPLNYRSTFLFFLLLLFRHTDLFFFFSFPLGAFDCGYGGDPISWGGYFANTTNTIVVGLNYRVGVLGKRKEQ